MSLHAHLLEGWDDQAEQMAKRQARSRESNERAVEQAVRIADDRRLRIVCECGRLCCDARLELSGWEYERLRLIPTRFAVLAGHETPAVERTVEQNERFAIIEKVGETAALAIRLDPRRRPRLAR